MVQAHPHPGLDENMARELVEQAAGGFFGFGTGGRCMSSGVGGLIGAVLPGTSVCVYTSREISIVCI